MKNIIDRVNEDKPFYEKNVINDLFSWQELENLLNMRPFVSSSRFVMTKDDEYKWPMQSWLSDVNTWPPTIIDKVIREDVCYLSDCSRVNKKINNICKSIEEKWNYPTDAHIYFSFKTGKNSKGFSKHWDYNSNIIIQIDGQTNFKIWNKKVKEGNRQIKIEEEPMMDVILNPGDVIFIPKFMVHQAISLSKRLSISFPMSAILDGTSQDRHWIKINA